MRTLIWGLAWAAVALWSLVAWGAYGLVEVIGGLAVRNADLLPGSPEAVEWLSWGLAALKGLGLAALTALWGLVSLAVLALAWVLARIAGTSRRPTVTPYGRG